MSYNKFTLSAPGRIVLSGEHSAIYQKYFVASALDLRTKLQFWELDRDAEIITLVLTKINLQLNLRVEQVKRFFDESLHVRSDPLRVLEYVKSFVAYDCTWRRSKQRYSLIIFFFLLFTIAQEETLEIKPFRVRVITKLPIDSGLGSSTSYAVCLAACFLYWHHLQNDERLDEFTNEILMKVEKYVKSCEEIMHDVHECSPIDVNVCVYGNLVISRLTNINIPNFIERIDIVRMNILLIDSNVRQKKSEQARQMADLQSLIPIEFESALKKLEKFARKLYTCLICINENLENRNSRSREYYDNSLQLYIRRTQKYLRKKNLSHQAFDNISAFAERNQFGGKMTGFGARYAFILLPPSVNNETIDNIKSQLTNQNLTYRSSTINCHGLKLESN